MGVLLLVYFVSCDPSYLELAYSVVSCLIILLFSMVIKHFVLYFSYIISTVVPSFKKYITVYASVYYIFRYFQFLAGAHV